MTRNEQILQTKRLSGVLEANTAFDSLIVRALNDGDKDFASEVNWPFLEETRSTAIVRYKQKYDLPADFDTLKNIKYRQKFLVTVVSDAEWERLNQSFSYGTPEYCHIWNNKLQLYPQPNDTPVSTTLDTAMAVGDTTATLTSVSSLEPRGRLALSDGASFEVMEYAYLAGSIVSVMSRGLEGTTPSAWDVGTTVEYQDIEEKYYKTLSDITTTGEVSSIDVRYHEAPVLYATARFFESQENQNMSTHFQNLYLIKKEKAKADLGQKTEQGFSTTLDDTMPQPDWRKSQWPFNQDNPLSQ